MIWSAVLAGRARLLAAGFTRRGARGGAAPGRPLIAAALALALATFVTLGLMLAFITLREDGGDARDLALGLGLLLDATFVALVAFDLNEAVSALLLDSDLELLRRAPIRRRALLALKLLDAVPRTSALLVLVAAPALFAYAQVAPVGAAWLLLGIPALLALWATAFGIGIAAAVTLLRVVPARVARETLGLLSTLALLVLWLANAFVIPRLALGTEAPVAALRTLATRSPLPALISPGGWLARVFAAAAEHRVGDALAAFLVLAGIATVALGAGAAIAGAQLEAVEERVAATSTRRAIAQPLAQRFPGDGVFRALVRRDLRLIGRDWPVIGDLLVTSFLWTLLPLLGLPIWQLGPAFLARAMMIGLTVALGFELGTRTLPLERRALAWTRLAPVSPWRWLIGRCAAVALCALAIVLVATTAIAGALRLDVRTAVGVLGATLPALALALATGIATGAFHADPEWKHPRAMLTLGGRVIATALLLAQAIGWLVLAAAREAGAVFDFAPLATALALVGAVLALGLAAVHLGRHEWT